jgi:hypothetical protein
VPDALLDAGAEIGARGATFMGGTPISDAAVFGRWRAARRLIERGARTTIRQDAAAGLLDRVEACREGEPSRPLRERGRDPMTRRALIFLAFAILAAPVASAKVKVEANEPGRLGVEVAIATSQDFIQVWLETPSSEPVTIPRLRELRIGGTAFIAFLVTGYAPGEDGTAEYVVDCKIRGPKGTVLFDLPGSARFKGPVEGRGSIMADPALDFVSDAEDRLGVYRVQAAVRGAATRKKAKGEARFTLVP